MKWLSTLFLLLDKLIQLFHWDYMTTFWNHDEAMNTLLGGGSSDSRDALKIFGSFTRSTNCRTNFSTHSKTRMSARLQFLGTRLLTSLHIALLETLHRTTSMNTLVGARRSAEHTDRTALSPVSFLSGDSTRLMGARVGTVLAARRTLLATLSTALVTAWQDQCTWGLTDVDLVLGAGATPVLAHVFALFDDVGTGAIAHVG